MRAVPSRSRLVRGGAWAGSGDLPSDQCAASDASLSDCGLPSSIRSVLFCVCLCVLCGSDPLYVT